jgi:predicted metal-dependent peptidase
LSTATTTANKKDSAEFKSLLGPTVPAQDREARERLVTARVGLLLRASFFGNLATRLKLVNADEWCPTAGTDGRNFYYNSRFVLKLKPRELEFLFGHEVLHVVYDHMGRRGDRDPQLWNIADDYCVNADLIKHRVGERITTVPCLYDAKYEGWSAEEVYDDLYENAEKINIDQLVERLLDDHMDGDGDGGEQQGDSDESGKGRPRLTPDEKQKIRDEIKEAVLAAAAAESGGAGNLPAGVQRMIQELTAPKLNWRELLRMQLESTIKNDYTWMRTSRRSWHLDSIMPGMNTEPMIDIAVAIDASGSISTTMLRDFLAEIQGIMESFPAFRIHVVTFDTECYNPAQYDSDNLDTICDYDIRGGGGTDFECVFKYLKENEIEPKRLVIFTDMYPFGSWGDANYADTIFVAHGTTSIVAPYGITTYYDETQ